MSSHTAAKAAQAANRVILVHKKYTLQSTGIWERIRRLFAVDPTRSNGVPLNPQFRNPPPGANNPFSFTDPVTVPAGDIAENPYWKRDARRAYPKLSVVGQKDLAGLLMLGSEKAPKRELIGEEGKKELVSVGEEVREAGGLQRVFGGGKEMGELMGKDGLPPLPSSLGERAGVEKYTLTAENAYPEEYPCRTFQ